MIDFQCLPGRLDTFPLSPQLPLTQTQIEPSILIIGMLLLKITLVIPNRFCVLTRLKAFVAFLLLAHAKSDYNKYLFPIITSST
jgi:hypothetical protein